MNKRVEKFFSNSKQLKRKGLTLFFILFGLVMPLFFVNGWDGLQWIGEQVLNAIVSLFFKALGVLFLPGLFLSNLFIAITGLILGWIIGPNFISLQFTQNPFVDIGLSITKGFANMGFILFLVAIALATVLRIEEYKAKKTLTTLIIVALLVNFSPVLCGIIIDASNIVMNFFLNNITGLNAFVNNFTILSQTAWNLIVGSGFDPWANMAAFMQVLVLTFFNFFAGFIFVLFSALFIMRYIMLWILVILSPIAFVSYILPATRRGRSLLSWRTWWEQLIAWSFIGMIAGFFLYLGFTMISLIAAAPGTFVIEPNLAWQGGGLGLMNNVLPYLIPLVLLWIAYREAKRTSAMFAKEIVEAPEKIAKTAVQAAAMVAVTAATAGAGAAIGAAKGAPGAIGAFQKRMDKYETDHPETAGGRLAGWMSRRAGTLRGKDIDDKLDTKTWAGRRRKGAENLTAEAKKTYGEVKEDIGEWTKKQKQKHPDAAAIIGWTKKQTKKGLTRVVLGREEKERELRPEEERDKVRYKYDEEKKEWVKTKQGLTKKEIDSRHLIDIEQKPGIMPVFKDAMKTVTKGFDDAIEDQLKKMGAVVSSKLQKDLEKINDLITKREAGETITEDDVVDMGWAEKIIKRGDEITLTILKKRKEELEGRAAKEIKGLKVPKVSEFFSKTFRKRPKTPKENETRPPTPPPPTGPGPEETGEDDSSGRVSPDETGEGDSSGGVSPEETG